MVYMKETGVIEGHLAVIRNPGQWPPSSDIKSHALVFGRWQQLAYLTWFGIKAQKIIVHGLFDRNLIVYLLIQPWLWHKTCWIVWGGDVYQYQQKNTGFRVWLLVVLRKLLVHVIPEVVSATPGDGDLVRRWYGFQGKYSNIFTYPNSIVTGLKRAKRQEGSPLKILLGNSATHSNHHLDAMEKLHALDDGQMQIFCPLAYGDQVVARQVIETGQSLFGDRFRPMESLTPYDDYQSFLSTIDIAVFNHDRQQAMGTTRALLALGVKVYLRPNTTTFQHLSDLGICVFDLDKMNLEPVFPEMELNVTRMRQLYSETRFREGLTKLFGVDLWAN